MSGLVDEMLTALAETLALPRAELEPARAVIVAAWERAAAAWPDVPVAAPELARAWGRALDGQPVSAVADLHPDLRVAASALAGHPAAIRALDAELRPSAAVLMRRGWNEADLDDVLQIVRARLLVATAAVAGRLAQYRGRSSLRTWLRVVVTREALARRPVDHDTLPSAEAVAADPIAGWLNVAHGDHVRAGLREAVQALPARQRAALRMECVDRKTHGAIAKIYGVHRTSVVRWCEDARAAIASHMRRYLVRVLELPLADVDSHLRGVASQLELSLAALLASSPSDG